jgi:hypothetical protein
MISTSRGERCSKGCDASRTFRRGQFLRNLVLDIGAAGSNALDRLQNLLGWDEQVLAERRCRSSGA